MKKVHELSNSGQLSEQSPDRILQTLWFYNTVPFGLRGSVEQRGQTPSMSGSYLQRYAEKRPSNYSSGTDLFYLASLTNSYLLLQL